MDYASRSKTYLLKRKLPNVQQSFYLKGFSVQANLTGSRKEDNVCWSNFRLWIELLVSWQQTWRYQAAQWRCHLLQGVLDVCSEQLPPLLELGPEHGARLKDFDFPYHRPIYVKFSGKPDSVHMPESIRVCLIFFFHQPTDCKLKLTDNA